MSRMNQGDAVALVESRSYTNVLETVRIDLYHRWLRSASPEEREKNHAVAVAAETFFHTLETMAREEAAEFETTLTKHEEEAVRAVY